jgi:probable HAF family extracellular repeat protein
VRLLGLVAVGLTGLVGCGVAAGVSTHEVLAGGYKLSGGRAGVKRLQRRSHALAVNSTGEIVVGWSNTPLGGTHAVVWFNGKIRDLGKGLGGFSMAVGVNDGGEIIINSDRQAFVWRKGTLTNLGDLGGTIYPRAIAINGQGEIVGSSGAPDGKTHGFLWQDGRLIDLGAPTGSRSEPTAINDQGVIVGWNETADRSHHAFLWQNGAMTDLGTLGGANSEATGINNSGQVVGWSDIDGANRHAFLWQDGVMTDLGTLRGGSSRADAINESGQVVGSSGSSGTEHVVLWESGTMTDLGPGGDFRAAINDSDNPCVTAAVFGSSSAGTDDAGFVWRSGVRQALWIAPTAVDDECDVVGDGPTGHAYEYSGTDGGVSDLGVLLSSREIAARKRAAALATAVTCVLKGKKIVGCINRAVFGYGEHEWDVSVACGNHIAGNANYLWLYEGFHPFESASRRGKVWFVGNGDAELGTVRPRPHTKRRWDFFAPNGRRVAWARGPDGGAAGLAWFGAGPGCIGNK